MILKPALKQTFSKSFWGYFSTTGGGFVVFFLIGKNFFNLDIKWSVIICASVGIFLIFIRFVFVYGCLLGASQPNELTAQSNKKCAELEQKISNAAEEIENLNASFSSTILSLNEAFSAIHWLRTQTLDNKNYFGILEFMCSRLKQMFDERTDSKCAISIKIPVEVGEITSDTRLMNICRDKWSLRRNTDEYKAKPHYVYNNTAFNVICSRIVEDNEHNFYLNNDIPNSHDYQNSSLGTYVDDALPYQSEIVVPIIPIYKPMNTRYVALGFLCADSERMNAFDDIDVGILQGVVDCIHDLIKQRESLVKPEQFLIVEGQHGNMKATPFVIKDRKPKRKK